MDQPEPQSPPDEPRRAGAPEPLGEPESGSAAEPGPGLGWDTELEAISAGWDPGEGPEAAPRIHTALLCDSATIREGLLHVLGAGISRIWRPRLPAPLGLTLALLVEVAPSGLTQPHQFSVNITGPEDQPIATVMGAFGLPPNLRRPRTEPGERPLIPAVVDLRGAAVAHHGRHTMSVSVDVIASVDLLFWVLHPEEMSLPSLDSPNP
ncbi:MAG: DUF6941 family protein [Acidimicrobiales bacterium]